MAPRGETCAPAERPGPRRRRGRIEIENLEFCIQDSRGAAAGADCSAGPLVRAARGLLAREATGTAFRLIGIGANPLAPRDAADHGDLADTETPRMAAAQAAIDALRERFGETSVIKGRALRAAR
jgi:DNA polymerase-4